MIFSLLVRLIAVGALLMVAAPPTPTAGSQELTLRMPDIRPDHEEQYLCTALRLPVDERGLYITGFVPRANASRVHHMLLYGCQMPGVFERDSPRLAWDCGEMHNSAEETNGEPERQQESYLKGPVCKGGNLHMLYGWALDAPALTLPKSVGFKIGEPTSGINYLVLQVHYGHYHVFQQNPQLTDNSGLTLNLKPNEPESGITRQAGVLLMISLGQVEQGLSKHEIWCDMNDDIEIHPFRYRVHTHKLGTRVLGARLHSSAKSIEDFQQSSMLSSSKSGANNKKQRQSPRDTWIGVGDPQKPQMFYPVKEKDLTIRKGDKLYAACEFNNTNSHAVQIGQTAKDEMCNFYMMYWTDSPRLLSKGACFGQNPKTLFSPLQKLWFL